MISAPAIIMSAAGVSLALIIHGWRGIWRKKREGWAEDAPMLERRRRTPLVFVSFQRADRAVADEVASILSEGPHYEVMRYDPDHPWDDPTWTIINAFDEAAAIVYVSGASSNWVEAEKEIARSLSISNFTVRSADDLRAQLPTIEETIRGPAFEKRIRGAPPHDRSMVSMRVMSEHTGKYKLQTKEGENERSYVAMMEFLSDPWLALARLEVLAGYFGIAMVLLAAIVLAIMQSLA
jgi:hypothetical protein